MDAIRSNIQEGLSSFQPFAKRTTQLIRQQLGQSEDQTELPAEYLELEKRVDNLKAFHQKLLNVTSHYESESYDYPANLKESLTDFGKSVSEKVKEIAHAQNTTDLQAVMAKPSPKTEPKTMNHALARASLGVTELLGTQSPIGNALAKYAVAQEKVGNARLAQDAEINSKFNSAMQVNLNTQLAFAYKARRNVQNARLMLDSAKAAAKVARPEKADAARVEVEQAEDTFVAAVDESVALMKDVVESSEPLKNLADLITAQRKFYEEAAKTLGELDVDQIASGAEAAGK